MKHNTHIYIALKSVEFLYDALKNFHNIDDSEAKSSKRTKARKKGKTLQRLLNYHKDKAAEACWAPDDLLQDYSFHIFKLFTASEFTDYQAFAKETHIKNSKKYYRASGGGGGIYRIEHLARVIQDMIKFRNYNDNFSMKQIMYMFFLLSHYVVDLHVPMHCDIRDDKPSEKKPSGGAYYKDSWHGKIEKYWDDACTPVAIKEKLFDRERALDKTEFNYLSDKTIFDLGDKNHIAEIKTYDLETSDLIDFLKNVCIDSKERNLTFFPIGTTDSFDNVILETKTREIFAKTIGNLISIWVSIWPDG